MERGLGWIDAHLDDFDPFRDDRPFEIRRGQRVGELAILLRAFVGLTGRASDPRVVRIVALLERVQRHPEFVARLIRSPIEFILFAEVYAHLRAIGRDSPDMHALIQCVIDAGFLDQVEQFPNRMMDIRACLDTGGFEADYPSLSDLFERSILARRVDPLLVGQEGLYAVTHVLMFLYGFGTRDHQSPPPHATADLELLLPGMLVVVAQERHWDLVAELLICWECLGLPASRISELAWEELERLQDSDGTIPGPEWAARLHEELGQPADADVGREQYFSHHYHTTLVSVIAACLRARRLEGRSPTDSPQSEPKRRRRGPRPSAQDAARAAGAWLDRLADDVLLGRPDAQPSVLSQLLLGQWLVVGLAGDPPRQAAPQIVRIGESLAQWDDLSETAWSETPATQSLLVARLLELHGIFVPYLHAPDGFVGRAVAALRPDGATTVDDLALTEPHALLQNLGSLPRSTRLEASELTAWAGRTRLSAGRDEIDTLVERVEAHTACGTEPARLQSPDAWIAELLVGVAAYSLRRYDLVRAARLLRAVNSLQPLSAPGSELVDDCVRFLHLNQRPDGAFGFIAPEARSFESKRPRLDREQALSLPITVECLWALAELESDWRLFSSLAR